MKSDRRLAHPNILRTFPLSAAGKPHWASLGPCRTPWLPRDSASQTASEGREDRPPRLPCTSALVFRQSLATLPILRQVSELEKSRPRQVGRRDLPGKKGGRPPGCGGPFRGCAWPSFDERTESVFEKAGSTALMRSGNGRETRISAQRPDESGHYKPSQTRSEAVRQPTVGRILAGRPDGSGTSRACQARTHSSPKSYTR